jgi:hypothetical protein
MATAACYNFSYSLGNYLGSLGKSTRTLSFVHRSLKVRVLNLQHDFRVLRGSVCVCVCVCVCVYDCYRYTGMVAELSYWSLYEYPSYDYGPHDPEHPLF